LLTPGASLSAPSQRPLATPLALRLADDTFNISGSYAPINGLTFRAAQARTVRSPSIIEMFDPGLRAFGGLSAQSHPCATVNIDSGPAPATRRANCIAAVKLYGIAANRTLLQQLSWLRSLRLQLPTARQLLRATRSWPTKKATRKTFGVTIEPSFIPGLVLAVDYFDVELTGELGLTGTPTTTNACFDSAAFPNSIVGSANPACDAFLFAQPSGGNNIVPLVNPLTGRTTILKQCLRRSGCQPEPAV
jgi:iron complex outermembrane recepter protein